MCLLKNVAIVQNNECYYQNCIENAYEIKIIFSHLIHDGNMSLVERVYHFFPKWLSNFVYPLLHGLDLCPARYRLLSQGPLNWFSATIS